ncbi:CYTH domain-containing protein [Candidatus Poribacteria bacterium]|nr:CYTH domain-containing protein [Candidatus Poribacteria bacterium]
MDRLANYHLGVISELHIIDRYMDTANMDILKAGYALRIREKDGECLVTLKGLGTAYGAIHQREEYEIEIESGKTLQEWPDGKIRNVVSSFIGPQTLVELFIIYQFRRIRSLKQKRRNIGYMSYDIVDIKLKDRIHRTYELEVELGQEGTMEDLKKIDVVFKSYGLCPETKSKFERAMEIAGVKY